MHDAQTYLAEVAARLTRITDEAYPDPNDRNHNMTEPPGITDDDWLGLVAIIFTNYGLTATFAVDTVTTNRDRILEARRQGADPADIVEFAWETFGPPPPCAFQPSHRTRMTKSRWN